MACIAIIGDGGWGTALALTAHHNGHETRVWGAFEENIAAIRDDGENRAFLPGVPLPGEILWTTDRAAACRAADLAILAVPTRYFRAVAASFRDVLPPETGIVTVAKGLDRERHIRMSEVAAEELDRPAVAALSGPSHAEEVARGVPTAVTVAGRDEAYCRTVQGLLANRRFRVYTSSDIVGVELGGALKNVIAIGVGVSDGLGFGDNTRAALITRGLAEITRLGCALGARPETFAGLAGMGDLIVTCTSRHSRNRAVGERLGRGEAIESILGGMRQVAEGVWNCGSAVALAEQHAVEMPVSREVHAILRAGKAPADAVESLLGRDFKPEL